MNTDGKLVLLFWSEQDFMSHITDSWLFKKCKLIYLLLFAKRTLLDEFSVERKAYII